MIFEKKEALPRGCSSAGRAPALQAGGHGFDSHHLHQFQGKAAKRLGLEIAVADGCEKPCGKGTEVPFGNREAVLGSIRELIFADEGFAQERGTVGSKRKVTFIGTPASSEQRKGRWKRTGTHLGRETVCSSGG